MRLKWIILIALAILYSFFRLSFEVREIVLEKDRTIEEMQAELISANERIGGLEKRIEKDKEKISDYQEDIIYVIEWAEMLFPWGSGGALEHLTETSVEDLDLNDEIKRLPLSIPEADQRVRFMERIKKWPLSEYNYAFATLGWIFPVLYPENSYVSEEFVKFYSVKASGRYFSGPHPANDIVSPWDSSAVSVADGRVTVVHIEPLFKDILDEHPLELYVRGMGSYVVIEHTTPNNEKLYSVYGHLTQVLVQVGEEVEKEEIIGVMGSSGISEARHLHFEIRKYLTETKYMRLNPFTNSLQGNVIYTTFFEGKFE